MSNAPKSDLYLGRDISEAARTLGYWLVAAALIHAVAQPVAEAVINRIAMKAYQSEMQSQMDSALNAINP
jgi:hypothetical protein